MRFLTVEESRQQVRCFQHLLGEHGFPVYPTKGLPSISLSFAKEPGGRLFWLSQQLLSTLGEWEWCLMWVRLTGVWESGENLHLYYRLRHSYLDERQVEDAPGHLALPTERADLLSFLHIAVLNGWDAVLVSSTDQARVIVDHDEFAEVASKDPAVLARYSKEFTGTGFKVRQHDGAG